MPLPPSLNFLSIAGETSSAAAIFVESSHVNQLNLNSKIKNLKTVYITSCRLQFNSLRWIKDPKLKPLEQDQPQISPQNIHVQVLHSHA